MTQLTTKRELTTDTSVWTPEDVKRFFDPQNLLTPTQVGQALSLIKGNNLNPFKNEVYIVAYRTKSGVDFSLIVSKEAFMKRAERCHGYDGFSAGITVIRNGELKELEGTLKMPEDILIGGWAVVYRNDRNHAYKMTVALDEYQKTDKYGNPRSTWKTMPNTMIRKTALVQALREAFPDELSNMYTDVDGGDSFDMKDVTPQQPTQQPQPLQNVEEKKTVADLFPKKEPEKTEEETNVIEQETNSESELVQEDLFSEVVE